MTNDRIAEIRKNLSNGCPQIPDYDIKFLIDELEVLNLALESACDAYCGDVHGTCDCETNPLKDECISDARKQLSLAPAEQLAQEGKGENK